MSDHPQESQFQEVRPLVETLFDLSQMFVSRYGNFLPHGGALTDAGEVMLCNAAPENEQTNALEVLPLLLSGLRENTGEPATQAVAFSENVYIGADQQPAIKVSVEHRSGLSLAMYQPWTKRMLRGPKLGEIHVQEAEPEVGQWRTA